MNSLWMWFLYRLNGWTLRQIREEVVRQKVRWFKRELNRQFGARN
jgi:hypothetical protein